MRITITVLGWAKFNPRADRKKHTWFRVDHSIATDPQFLDFSAEELWVWMAVLAQASSKANGDPEVDGTFSLPANALYRYCRAKAEVVESALAKLIELGCVEITRSPSGNQSVSPPVTKPTPPGNQAGTNGNQSELGGSTTYERTDERTHENERTDDDEDARARETSSSSSPQLGPVPELAETVGAAELLRDISQEGQRVWIRVFGLETIRRELPFVYAKWKTDEARAAQGGLSLYLLNWFKNAKAKEGEDSERESDRPAAGAPPLRNTRRPCRAALNFPNVCEAHGSGDYCAIEGRPPPPEPEVNLKAVSS